MSIHQTAIVDGRARLGRDVQVGPFAVIEGDVEIGDGCVIGPRVSVMAHTTLGPGCKVHTGAVLGDWPQDGAFGGETSYVKIGANCKIREYVTIHRGTKPGTDTVVGDGCFLMALSHLAHNVRLGNNVIVANNALLAGYVEVGDRAFISGGVAVHQFVRIGRLAMVGGLAAVSKDVPPFCMVRTNGLNRIAGLNVVGLKRAGLTPAQRLEVKRAFDLLYRDGLNVSQAVVKIRESFAGGPALELAGFAEQSKRGLCAFSMTDRDGDEDDV